MSRKGLTEKLNGNGKVPVCVVLPGDATRIIRSANVWQFSISKDRPVYKCPNCTDSAVQFYRSHDLHPELRDFFRCHACGSCWEM
jgi:DNA-directed RNA polymerase subunit M/transcription elongation factor TFIIS